MKKINKNTIIGALLALFISGQVLAEVKVAVVDMQKAIQGSASGKLAKKKLEKAFNKKKKKLEQLESDLKKMREDLEKKSLVMSDEVKLKRQQEFQKKYVTFQQKRAKSEQEIRQEEQKLTQPILVKIKSVIKSIAKKEKYTMVFQKAEHNVLFAEASIDITKRVIKELSKKK
ncbi:MAG: OmpH family outer membrane protein [Bdellovibrionaceae bacterium]|jgi:outer membrane protein|nr:OmpH family outer membrane protein [Pseudobdellovibrionaceae bacterium]